VYVSVRPGASSAVVTGLRGAAHATPAGSATQAGWKLHAVPARNSLADLHQVMDRVPATLPGAVVWYVDPRQDRVVVGLPTVTAADRRAATAAFGDRVQVITHEQPRSMVGSAVPGSPPKVVRIGAGSGIQPQASDPDRLTDSLPYAGGDRIIWWDSKSVRWCTGGFAWAESSGQEAMSTAGHCGALGETWYQGYYQASNNTIYYTGIMGKPNLRSWGDGPPDAELMTGGASPFYYPWVYTVGPILHQVVDYHIPVTGQGICADGSMTEENCAGVVQSADVCTTIIDDDKQPHRVCHQTYATAGSRLDQPGDSGGPVYDFADQSAGTLRAMGTISAGNSAGTDLYFTNIFGYQTTVGGEVLLF
jgi:hypothetical protein